MPKSLVQAHWDYLLLMEKDLISVAETVELCEENYSVYGPRIVQLILAVGSELDVALKSFAKTVDSGSGAATKEQPTMRDYKQLIHRSFPGHFSEARVKILRSEIILSPWSALRNDAGGAIPWWKTYNDVKHRRAECYSKGTLETALNLIAALFVVDAYLVEASGERVSGFTQIIDWDKHIRML